MKKPGNGMLPQKRLQDDFNRARKSANDNAAANDEYLPRWDLAALYKSPDAPELKSDLAQIDKLCDEFVEAYEGTLEWLSGSDLGKALGVYEQIEALRHKVSCYITLMESDDVANFARLGDLNKWFQENGGKIGFFEAELATMKEQTLMPKLSAPELAAYAPWLAALRAREGQSLPDGIGGLSADFATTSREGWGRFYHETINALRVEWQGEKLSLDDMAEHLSTMTLDERKEGRAAMAAALKAQSARIALCYNAMIRDDLIDNELAGVTRPDAPVNRANRASDETVDTMFDTIKSSYARLSHRFYEWKAQQHGQEVMPRAQVGMKLPGLEDASHEYSFGEAKRLVMRAFRKFSPKFARLAEKVFSAGHIDAEPREGKDTGAFALPAGPGDVPYVMLSFTGSASDVAATLGHELGHAVHQQLAEKACGFFMSDVPTPVAETASIFAEM
ncbi:MAG TPA: M3 family metallopeptidase, partial [Alphaproteobacteria bacterium]|nr:M3 family metallopeptidase [Alphaproteobacteria bacterium]